MVSYNENLAFGRIALKVDLTRNYTIKHLLKGRKALNFKVTVKNLQLVLSLISFAAILVIVPFNISCSAFETAETEEQALQSLRQMMKDGKLPPEAMVAGIESRFSGTKTGALAKILRAHIRLSNGDGTGAAEILNSSIFKQKSNVADYALWLRAKALKQAAKYADAMSAAEQLLKDFPGSIRAREAKLVWAESALPGGQPQKVPEFLADLAAKNDADALLLVAKSYEQTGNQPEAINSYRKVYFLGVGTNAWRDAEAKLNQLGQSLEPQTAEEASIRADKLIKANNYSEAQKTYDALLAALPTAATPKIQLKRLIVSSTLRNAPAAQSAFNSIPDSNEGKAEGYYYLSRAYAIVKLWSEARRTVDEMRQKFPNSSWTPKTLISVGMLARDAKSKLDEAYFLRTAVTAYPNAIDVAQAQFELAWLEHDSKNFALSSQMLTEHLGRYADKDTTYRGRAGYWSARDSERAGKIPEACALYEAVIYRYNSNWYGYLASQRIANLKALNKCGTSQNFGKDSMIGKAVSNLKSVTVAPETSGPREQERFGKAEQLSSIGLFDWAIEELNDAARTAANSPKVNLAVAKLYRQREDNTSALLALARSYPDYAQMFPEEMSKEDWDIFYPLHSWDHIKNWARNRNLDHYQVAGLIRQESVFNSRAKSSADAYGLMQLLIPTARTMARKYGSAVPVTLESLFTPATNIELGTAYMRDMFDKFGRIEYVACAYNAGPGRVPPWRASLPLEIDEFVEAIPFRETKGYVQGVIRNSAQYRRLYDDSGNFKANVGTKPVRQTIDTLPRERIAQELPDVVLDRDHSGEE